MTGELQDIISRLEKLEMAVFTKLQDEVVSPPNSSNNFSGPKGGILLLIEKDFFEAPHAATEVKDQIAKNGYHYSIQAVQTALNRLSSTKGPLNALKDAKKKVYVGRK